MGWGSPSTPTPIKKNKNSTLLQLLALSPRVLGILCIETFSGRAKEKASLLQQRRKES
jgi:hypothetical protein